MLKLIKSIRIAIADIYALISRTAYKIDGNKLIVTNQKVWDWTVRRMNWLLGE